MSSGLSMASVNKIKELASQREYSLALDIIESQDLSKSLNPQFLRLCGEIYIKNNKLKKARRTLLMSRNLAPESKRVIMLLMDLYYRIGFSELAERYYEIYLFEAGQDGADTKLADYLHEKATGNDLETLSEILGSTYAHTMDYEWSYELFLIYILRDKKNRAEEIAELYEATFKNSANAELMRAILEGSEDAEEHFRVYATETSEDDSPSEEDLRKIEAKLFEADDLRQHPVEAEITEEVDSLYEQISKRQMKKLLREQARREARAESESDASAEDGDGERVLEEVSEETEKRGLFSKVFGRRRKGEDDDVLEVTESVEATGKTEEAKAPEEESPESDHREAPETEPEKTEAATVESEEENSAEVSEAADTEAASEPVDSEDVIESDPDPDWVNSVPDAVVIEEDDHVEEEAEEKTDETPEDEASDTDTEGDTDESFVPAHPPRSSAIVESVELEDIESDSDEEFDDFGDWDEDDEFGDIEETSEEVSEITEPDEASESITEDVETSEAEPSESDYEAWEEDEPKEDFTDASEPWIEDDIPEEPEAEAEPEEEVEFEAEAEPEEEAEFEEEAELEEEAGFEKEVEPEPEEAFEPETEPEPEEAFEPETEPEPETEAEPEETFEPEAEPEVAPQFEYEAPEPDPDYVYEGELIEDEPETVDEYEEEPEPETAEEFEEEPEPEATEEYEEEPEPEAAEEYEEEPEPETAEDFEEEPEPEAAEAYEEEPEPAYDPNSFNISYKKKKLDYPVFRSTLFPNYHKEYKDVENHFGDIMEKSNETLNENLEKERRLQQEAEELLKSLGIEIDSGKKTAAAPTVSKQAPRQEVKPEAKPEPKPKQKDKPAERALHEAHTVKRDRTALKNGLKVNREMRETLRKLKDNR